MNGSSRRGSGPTLDPLEEAEQASADAEAERVALSMSDDFEEDTSRVTVNLHHVPQPSQPELVVTKSEAPPKVKALTRVLELLPPFGRVVVVLALIGAAVYLIVRGVKLF